MNLVSLRFLKAVFFFFFSSPFSNSARDPHNGADGGSGSGLRGRVRGLVAGEAWKRGRHGLGVGQQPEGLIGGLRVS